MRILLLDVARPTVAAGRERAFHSRMIEDVKTVKCECWLALAALSVQPATVPSRLRGGVDYKYQSPIVQSV